MTALRTCNSCSAVLTRKRWRTGEIEAASAFSKRRFCDRSCMAEWMDGQTKIPNYRNGRRQSSKTVGTDCVWCRRSDTRLIVHHIDENPLNNAPGNLLTLCGSFHRKAHSPNFDPLTGQRRACRLCEKAAMKVGLCWTHNTRLKRYGDPLVTRSVGRRKGAG